MRKILALSGLIILLVGISIFLRVKVNILTMNIQKTEWKIAELKEENKVLRIDIQKLKTYDAVLERLNDPDLYYSPDNVIVIQN